MIDAHKSYVIKPCELVKPSKIVMRLQIDSISYAR